MEEELSTLQLTPKRDLQFPTITSRQQGCRIETEAVIEQEPRGKSSAMEVSNREYPSANKPEVAERHQRLTSQEQEVERLQRLAADWDRRLTRGFYPTPYAEQGRPPTPGVAAGPEVYNQHSNAYGVYTNRSSFYSPPGYAQCVYPNGVQYTPFPEVQQFSRPDGTYGAYPYSVSHPSQGAEIRQVDKVLPEQPLMNGFSRQPEIEGRPATGKPVVQFYDTTSGNMVARPSPESRQDTTVKTPAETPETGSTDLEAVGTVYHTARTKCDNSSYREEPTTVPELRTKERKVLQYDSEDSEDDDVSQRRHRKGKAETDAKAGATRHSSRHSNGTSKRAIDPADAKVGSTQHSPSKKSNSSSQNVRSRTADPTSRHKK